MRVAVKEGVRGREQGPKRGGGFLEEATPWGIQKRPTLADRERLAADVDATRAVGVPPFALGTLGTDDVRHRPVPRSGFALEYLDPFVVRDRLP